MTNLCHEGSAGMGSQPQVFDTQPLQGGAVSDTHDRVMAQWEMCVGFPYRNVSREGEPAE